MEVRITVWTLINTFMKQTADGRDRASLFNVGLAETPSVQACGNRFIEATPSCIMAAGDLVPALDVLLAGWQYFVEEHVKLISTRRARPDRIYVKRPYSIKSEDIRAYD